MRVLVLLLVSWSFSALAVHQQSWSWSWPAVDGTAAQSGAGFTSLSGAQAAASTALVGVMTAVHCGANPYYISSLGALTGPTQTGAPDYNALYSQVVHAQAAGCGGTYDMNGVQVSYVGPGDNAAACLSRAGKFVDFRDSRFGTDGVSNWESVTPPDFLEDGYVGQSFCLDTCAAKATKASCIVRRTTGTSADVLCDVVAMYLVEPVACGPTDKAVGSSLLLNARSGLAAGGVEVSGGGAGTPGGTTPDSINLARIASNTAKLVEGQSQPIKVTVDGGSGGGGSCGGPDQPACNIADGTATQRAAVDGGAQGLIDALGSPSMFLPGDGRWLVSFADVLPTAACDVNLGSMVATGVNSSWFNVSNIHLDICAWATPLRTFLTWATALITIFGVWFILFKRG